jgi:hypothetical protein
LVKRRRDGCNYDTGMEQIVERKKQTDAQWEKNVKKKKIARARGKTRMRYEGGVN